MAKGLQLTTAEERLAALIWQGAPMTSPELVTVAGQKLGWKKSTTYTILKRLCDKGVFKNEDANVSVVLTQDELRARQSRHFVEDIFGGSLPKFITSFFGGKKLSPEQLLELKLLIDEHEEGGGGNG